MGAGERKQGAYIPRQAAQANGPELPVRNRIFHTDNGLAQLLLRFAEPVSNNVGSAHAPGARRPRVIDEQGQGSNGLADAEAAFWRAQHHVKRIVSGDGALGQRVAPEQRAICSVPDMQRHVTPACEQHAIRGETQFAQRLNAKAGTSDKRDGRRNGRLPLSFNQPPDLPFAVNRPGGDRETFRRFDAAQRGDDAQRTMQNGADMQRPLRAEDAETGKLKIFGEIDAMWARARAREAPLTKIEDAAQRRVVVQPLLRVAQHGIRTIDTLHLLRPARPCQVRMVASRQLPVRPLQCIAIRIYRDA